MKNNTLFTLELEHGIRLISLTGQKNMPPFPHTFSIALGNFDGVHTAHRLLLAAAVRKAADVEHCHSAVFCFEPPSSDYFNTNGTPGRHLSTLDEKLTAFIECGIEYVFLADFPQLKSMEPANFIEDVLKKVCCAKCVICGFNFRFGKEGAGTPALLKQSFGDDNCVMVAPCCMPTDHNSPLTVISSSTIRKSLADGRVETVRRLMGQPYSITAPVVAGKQLGRTIGIPTINQFFPGDKILLRSGIYVTRCLIDGTWVPGVSNVGTRPTVDDGAPINCETHLLNFDRDVYGHVVTVEFLHRLRDEQRFDSIEQLKNTIRGDIERTVKYFKT